MILNYRLQRRLLKVFLLIYFEIIDNLISNCLFDLKLITAHNINNKIFNKNTINNNIF